MVQEPVRRNRRDLVRALVLLAVMLPVCALLAEGFLRVAMPIPFEAPFRRELTQNLPGLAREFVYEQNAWGFRSLSMHSLEKPEGTFRILALGGSTTKQETQSTEDTWSGILETLLNDALGDSVRVEVLALGGSGKTAGSRVPILRDTLERVDPDLLITLEGVNDLVWNGLPGYQYAGPASFDAVVHPEASRLSRCRSRFQLCRRLKILKDHLQIEWEKWNGRALEWHSEHLAERREAYRELPLVRQPVRDPDPYVEFRDAVAALLDHARSADLPVLVLGQPVLWHAGMSEEQVAALWFWVGTPDGRVRAEPAWLEWEMRRYNEAQRREAAIRGFPYLDLDGRLPKDLDHFFDDCHLTDLGSRLQAEIIFPAVLAEVRAIRGEQGPGR
ncbi:MAG: SGNH/GDSL hydrolase family protein [Myxococcota bacterium]